MNSTISVSTGFSDKGVLRKCLLMSGILSSLLYFAMNIFVPMFWKDYSSVSQTVSELSAIDAPTRALWVPLGFVYTLLVVAFGFGVWQSTTRNRALRNAGGLIVAYAVVSLFWPLFPMHQREALAAGEETLSDTLHITLAMVTVFLMVIAMGFGAAAFGKRFRLYSIATILTLLVFGALTGLEAPKVSANLPTPWIGLWERINIGVFLLWVVVLASNVLRKEADSIHKTTGE